MDESWVTRKRLLMWGCGGLAFYMLLVVVFGAGAFAGEAERRAKQILIINGHDWARVERHGRGIAIQGEAPSAEAGAAAVEAVDADWTIRRAWPEFTVKSPSAAPAPSGASQSARLAAGLGDA